jgi:ABC-type thiamin/hydroxymethylpyrimidine transport system permease subunit
MIAVIFAFGLISFTPLNQIFYMIVLASLSSGVEAGFLGKIIGDMLKQTGLLKSFLISKQAKTV